MLRSMSPSRRCASPSCRLLPTDVISFWRVCPRGSEAATRSDVSASSHAGSECSSSKTSAYHVRKQLQDCAGSSWRWMGATPTGRASDGCSTLTYHRGLVQATNPERRSRRCIFFVTGVCNGSARPFLRARSQARGEQVLRQSRGDAIHAQPPRSRSSPGPGRGRLVAEIKAVPTVVLPILAATKSIGP